MLLSMMPLQQLLLLSLNVSRPTGEVHLCLPSLDHSFFRFTFPTVFHFLTTTKYPNTLKYMELFTQWHNFRGASQAERGDLRVLSGALSRHHVHDQDAEEDAVLLLQPHHPLHPDRIHGCAWLHSAPGLRGEAFSR